MGNMLYWMVFQVLLGIWLIISPFALGFGEMRSMALNSIVVGAIVTILGMVVAFRGLPGAEEPLKKST